MSEQTRQQLTSLQLEEGKDSVDAVIRELLAERRWLRFHESSELFRRKLSDEGIEFEDLVES